MGRGGVGSEHKARKLIYNYILSRPGSSFGEIRRVFDMNASTLKYHLIYMERSEKIESQRVGRRRCYYVKNRVVSNIDSIKTARADALTKTQKRLLNLIGDKPGISKDELQYNTKINSKNLNYNIRRLGELKLIWETKNNGVTKYELITSEKLREQMLNRLVLRLVYDEIDEQTFRKIKKKLESMDIAKLMR